MANDVNLYQTCSQAGIAYQSSSNYWWNPSISSPDGGALALPPSDYYSYALDDGSVVYVNVCAGSSICDGGVACTVSPNGFKTIYAYPTSAPSYYWYNGPTTLVLSYHVHVPEYRSVEISISCNYVYGSEAQISDVSFDDDDREYMNIYMTSPDICQLTRVPSFTAPRNYTSLTAPFFMAGDLPMFLLDAVSLSSETSTTSFVGTVYYSSVYDSFRMDGTLSNSNGDSSDVSYLYSGNQPLDNPPVIVSRVTLPGKSEPSCVLLPNPLDADDDDYEVDWFSASYHQNSFQSLSRNYTSIYFQKGTTFPVNVYTSSSYDTLVSLMESQYGGPIFVGIDAIAPFLGYQGESLPPFVSEFNWNTVDTTPLDSSMFDLPSNWNCQK